MTNHHEFAAVESAPAVRVDGLTVKIPSGRAIVSDVSFTIEPGEILALVGESGSGKTTVGMSLLDYTRHGAYVSAGEIAIAGQQLSRLSPEQRRLLRGGTISYVPQDPRASLNPNLRIRRQITEVLTRDSAEVTTQEARARLFEVLKSVGLPAIPEFANRFPHQLSGGQLQRVGIAMAIVSRPDVVVLDEPTTGLDVATQTTILNLVRDLCSTHGIAGLYVTHDLAVVADIADRVMVMREGCVVEAAPTATLFRTPQHDYTRRLIAAAPDIEDDPKHVSAAGVHMDEGAEGADDTGVSGTVTTGPALEVRDLAASYGNSRVLHNVSFDIGVGECVAVVGESGSGKSTLSRALIGLHPTYSGSVRWQGQELAKRSGRRSRLEVQNLQYIFQSPFTALHPRLTIGQSLEFAKKVVDPGTRIQRRAAVSEALERVGLKPEVAQLLPNRLSGGERQRVAIARALIAGPKLLICDEVTSALDVLVQEAIVDLLADLKSEEGLSMLFVTHNIALVKSIADRVLVLEKGVVAELGPCHQVLTSPEHPYTKALLKHTLSIERSIERRDGLVGSLQVADLA